MNKADLVAKVAKEAKLTKASAEKGLNTTLAIIKKTLVGGERIVLVGFGSFDVAHRKARKGRNPSTGKEIKIPASRVPRFRAGKALKEAINKKK